MTTNMDNPVLRVSSYNEWLDTIQGRFYQYHLHSGNTIVLDRYGYPCGWGSEFGRQRNPSVYPLSVCRVEVPVRVVQGDRIG